MRTPVRAVVALAASLALTSTLMPTASAQPTGSTASPSIVLPQPNSPNRWDVRRLSEAKKADARAVAAIQDYAIGAKRTALNYAKAIKVDQGRTAARRKFAAGWIYGGRPVKNISSAERAKVNAYLKQLRGGARIGERAPECLGETKLVVFRGSVPTFNMAAFDFYANSCHTSMIIIAVAGVGFVGGVVAAIVGGKFAGPIIGAIVLGAVALETVVLNEVRSASTLRSIIIRYDQFIVTVRPQ